LVAWEVVTKEKEEGGLGIRRMRDLNTAYLMKLGWRLHVEDTTLWARILIDKDGRGGDLLTSNAKLFSCSNAWRGTMETFKLTKQGMGIAVGDGRHTQFWNHRWLEGKTLVEQSIMAVPDDQLHHRVCDYWSSTGGWDWAQFETFLPNGLLQRIASYELAQEEVGDQALWIADSSGRFTIKSALKLIRISEGTTAVNWKWIWKMWLPQRIKMFLWLILHCKVLTNEERFRRQMSTNPGCALC